MASKILTGHETGHGNETNMIEIRTGKPKKTSGTGPETETKIPAVREMVVNGRDLQIETGYGRASDGAEGLIEAGHMIMIGNLVREDDRVMIAKVSPSVTAIATETETATITGKEITKEASGLHLLYPIDTRWGPARQAWSGIGGGLGMDAKLLLRSVLKVGFDEDEEEEDVDMEMDEEEEEGGDRGSDSVVTFSDVKVKVEEDMELDDDDSPTPLRGSSVVEEEKEEEEEVDMDLDDFPSSPLRMDVPIVTVKLTPDVDYTSLPAPSPPPLLAMASNSKPTPEALIALNTNSKPQMNTSENAITTTSSTPAPTTQPSSTPPILHYKPVFPRTSTPTPTPPHIKPAAPYRFSGMAVMPPTPLPVMPTLPKVFKPPLIVGIGRRGSVESVGDGRVVIAPFAVCEGGSAGSSVIVEVEDEEEVDMDLDEDIGEEEVGMGEQFTLKITSPPPPKPPITNISPVRPPSPLENKLIGPIVAPPPLFTEGLPVLSPPNEPPPPPPELHGAVDVDLRESVDDATDRRHGENDQQSGDMVTRGLKENGVEAVEEHDLDAVSDLSEVVLESGEVPSPIREVVMEVGFAAEPRPGPVVATIIESELESKPFADGTQPLPGEPTTTLTEPPVSPTSEPRNTSTSSSIDPSDGAQTPSTTTTPPNPAYQKRRRSSPASEEPITRRRLLESPENDVDDSDDAPLANSLASSKASSIAESIVKRRRGRPPARGRGGGGASPVVTSGLGRKGGEGGEGGTGAGPGGVDIDALFGLLLGVDEDESADDDNEVGRCLSLAKDEAELIKGCFDVIMKRAEMRALEERCSRRMRTATDRRRLAEVECEAVYEASVRMAGDTFLDGIKRFKDELCSNLYRDKARLEAEKKALSEVPGGDKKLRLLHTANILVSDLVVSYLTLPPRARGILYATSPLSLRSSELDLVAAEGLRLPPPCLGLSESESCDDVYMIRLLTHDVDDRGVDDMLMLEQSF
ncbi:hypothetical protein HDU67_008471 [Dinochytrium kinnereticum]|nr:hypothetical protein HDU67_008471 [Dinochytrium kinnereticum]